MTLNLLNEFRNFLENALDPIIGIDDQGIIQSVNSCTEEVFGGHKSEWIGQKFVEMMVVPFDQKNIEKALKEAVHKENGESSSLPPIEISLRKSDATQFPAKISITSIRINRNRLFYLFIKDISQQKYSLYEAKKTQEMYQEIVMNIKDYAISMLDHSGVVVSWNLGGEEIHEYKSDEIIGKHFSIFYPKEDIDGDKPQSQLKIAAIDGKFEEDNWQVRKDGTLFWAHTLITALSR